jgi:hypothetical protein
MPFPLQIANAAQVYLHWINAGKPFTNVLGASKPPGVSITQAMAERLGAAIKASVTSSGLGANMGIAAGLVTVGVRDINETGMPEYLDASPTVVGTAAGDPLPGQVALVVSLNTARSGTSYRGRVYLGGFTEAGNDAAGTATQPLADSAIAFLQAVSDAIAAEGMNLAVASRPREARTIPVRTVTAKIGFVTPVTSLVINNLLWDTQRRRATAGGGSTLLAGRTRRSLNSADQPRDGRSS